MNKVTITKLRKNGTVWLIMLYSLLSIMMVTFSLYQINQQEVSILSRGLYESNPSTFTVTDDEEPIDWRKLNKDDAYSIFVEIEESYRGFYYQEDTYSPPMVSGRYFEEEDFYNDKQRAVIGQSVSEDELEQIKRDGYEVIGIMGGSYSSPIDEMILFNIDAVEEGNPIPSAVYVLNINNGQLSPDHLNFNNTHISVDSINRGDIGAERFLGTENYQVITGLFFILLLFCLSFFFIQYWVAQRKIEIRILWQLGINPNKPYKDYVVSLFCITSFPYYLMGLISFFWVLQFSSNPQHTSMHTQNLLIGYGLILFSAGLSILLSYRKSRKYIMK
ncbi:FtsX-like permease family protein [Salsuginibacillus halophilus]|uniref:ABC3 transporter permease C-terminal domain-containing protein n=2 Tax=Bacillaceae TaxID=186817 RepID=A0A840QSJ2_9BACI|nr:MULTISPECIES: FtsX-like permease family protein [Bacillaceae]MBB5174486.1 hypothetical protein [Texcoconibacillus texcoconensis]PSL50644.1 FtsX-like permease family protein [Salsuginibacillus halophilus]